MRVWIISVLILFSSVEFYQWMRQFHFSMPMPVFILAGAFLAIASNYGKFAGWAFGQQLSQSEGEGLQSSLVASLTNAPNGSHLNPSSSTPLLKPRSISFTIRRGTDEQARNDKL